MNKKELQKFYESHHDYIIELSFYECNAYIKLKDFVRLVREVEIKNTENDEEE